MGTPRCLQLSNSFQETHVLEKKPQLKADNILN